MLSVHYLLFCLTMKPKQPNQHIVVMGVSGSGKTTLAQALAQHLNQCFIEGDDYHPAVNITKMKGGIPLNDSDRAPWLLALNTLLKNHNQTVVLACSALKQQYRDILSKGLALAPIWILLEGDRAVIAKRMRNRDHFMPVSLLESQWTDLEMPKQAVSVSCHLTTSEQLDIIMEKIR